MVQMYFVCKLMMQNLGSIELETARRKWLLMIKTKHFHGDTWKYLIHGHVLSHPPFFRCAGHSILHQYSTQKAISVATEFPSSVFI